MYKFLYYIAVLGMILVYLPSRTLAGSIGYEYESECCWDSYYGGEGGYYYEYEGEPYAYESEGGGYGYQYQYQYEAEAPGYGYQYEYEYEYEYQYQSEPPGIPPYAAQDTYGNEPGNPPPEPPRNVSVYPTTVCSPAAPMGLRISWVSGKDSTNGWWVDVSSDPSFNSAVKHIYIANPGTRTLAFNVQDIGGWEDWIPGLGQLYGGWTYYTRVYNVSIGAHSPVKAFGYRSCSVRLNNPTMSCQDNGQPVIYLNWDVAEPYGYEYFRVWDDYSNVDGTGFTSKPILRDYISTNYSFTDTTKLSGQPALYWIYAQGSGYQTWSNSGPSGVDGAGVAVTPVCPQPPPSQDCPSACHNDGRWIYDGTSINPTRYCAPKLPNSCTSAPNACGQTAVGVDDCQGTCLAVAPVCNPATINTTNSSCDTPGIVSWSGGFSYFDPGKQQYGWWVDVTRNDTGSVYHKWVQGALNQSSGSTTLPIDISWGKFEYFSGVGLSEPGSNRTFTVRVWNGSFSNTSSFSTGVCTPALGYSMKVGFNTYYNGQTVQITDDLVPTLSWSPINATACTAGGNWVGWSGDKSTNGGTTTLNGLVASNNTYIFSLSCVRGNGTPVTETIQMNVTKPPFIKTTGGNVHSNENINTPGQ